ncbi:GNAT family N-acetyltransferase [Candidatus Poribacteria bacterium]
MLAGERIYIRPLERTDLEGDTEWARMDPGKLREIHEKSQGDLKRDMFVILNEKRERIGHIEYVSYRPADRRTQCNISLSEPHTGQGYGTDALRIFSEFLFEKLEIDLIGLIVNMKNERAIHCYQKCGYSVRHRFPEKGDLVMVLERSDA